MRTCCNCGKQFESNRDKSYRCPSCKSAYNREHYTKNKDVYVARAVRRKNATMRKNTGRLLDYLRSHPCVDCGENDPVVLEFDHLRDKLYDVTIMVNNGHSWAAIYNEIQKCEVRCANCHRRVTAKRGNWRRTRLDG